MSYTAPETPVVQLSQNDEVEGGPAPMYAGPDSATNFVTDETSRQWVEQNVVSLVQYARDDGASQRDEWSKIRRMANLVRDETAAYQGQSEAYLPVYQKALETQVANLSQGLFPSDSYLDLECADPALEANTQANKVWMMHQLERSAKLRAEIKPFLRSLKNYGLGVAKLWWERPATPIKRSKLARTPGIEQLLYNYGNAQPWTCEGARFKARSVFSWYVWPTTVCSVDEASLVFEDIQVSQQFINQMAAKGIWKNTEDISSGTDLDANTALQETLSEVRGSSTTAADANRGELGTWRMVTECWTRMPVPKALYTPNETPGDPVPVKIVLAGGVVLEIRRNPFWHQKPPYVIQKMNENADIFATTGMGRGFLSLQGLINDFVNQTNDNGIYGLNPIIKRNPNLMVGPMLPLKPGRTYDVTDPSGIVFDRPPIEQMQYGLMILNQLITYANDFNGVPSVLQGSGAKGGAKTATGAQILQGNVKGEMQDMVEEIELRVLEPVMEMIHSLGQQYEAAERYFTISGGEKIQFNRTMLEGEYLWKWVASSQAVNRQMRAQQSTSFAQLTASLQPLLQAQGKMFDPEPLLRRIYEDGLGMRNFDRIIKAMPMAPPGIPGMGGPPGAPPGAGGPPAPQDPRSAVDQAGGGGEATEMVPGEGEALGEVRAEANANSAILGALGGG